MLTNEESESLYDAKHFARRSVCKRLQVGAVIRIDAKTSLSGWNAVHGPLESGEIGPLSCQCEDEKNVTRPEVVHAEVMLIGYAAAKGYSLQHKTLCVTHSPCMECAKLILTAKIAKVIYIEDYRSVDGIAHLMANGVTVVKAPGWSVE